MAKKGYVPRRRQEFKAWHNNFKAKAHLLATKYNISTTQLAKLDQNDTDVNTDFGDSEQKDLASKAANNKARGTQTRAERDSRPIAQQIKAHPDYTDEDGLLLDIIGPEDSTDPATVKPVLLLRIVEGSKVEIAFIKHGFTGVKILSKRGSETAFSFLTIDTESPYVDNRANLAAGAETRQYHAIFMDADHEVGLMSDIVTIAVSGTLTPTTPGGGGPA